jgi:hypothetical protein
MAGDSTSGHSPLERFIEALGPDAKVKHLGGGQYEALCPAHDDESASLSFRAGDDGRLLLNCHAGCSSLEVLTAAGLTWQDTFMLKPQAGAADPVPRKAPKPTRLPSGATVHVYETLNEQLELQRTHAHVRQGRGKAKRVWWVHWVDGQLYSGRGAARPVLYRAAEAWLAAQNGNRLVLLTEGEADADVAADWGLVACSVPDGADSLNRSEKAAKLLRPLAGADVVVLPDNDEPGFKMASKAVHALEGLARSVRVLELPGLEVGGDLRDWAENGGSPELLAELVAQAPEGRHWPGLLEPLPPGKVELLASVPTLAELLADPSLLEPERHLVAGLAYPGRLVMLAGQEKLGKSTILGHAVAAVSNGAEFIGHDTDAGLVLWLGYEEPARDPVRRLHAVGADAEQVRIMRNPLSHPQALELLRELRPVWVIIDSLVKWGEIAEKPVQDWGSSAQAGPVVNALADISHGYTIDGYTPAVTFTHHVAKKGGAYRDSSAIGAAVDLIATMKRPGKNPAEPRRLLEFSGRFAVDPLEVLMTEDGYQAVGAAVEGAALDERVAAVMAAVEADAGLNRAQLARAVGGRRADTLKLIDGMVESDILEVRQDGQGGGYYVKR